MRTLNSAEYRYKSLTLTVLPLRSDNYSYFIRDEETGLTLVVDPSETRPILEWIDGNGGRLDWIIDTHHHNDHIDGNLGLKSHFNAKIAASAYDIDHRRITGEPDCALRDGDFFEFGAYQFQVLETPGHTLGHICLFLQGAQWLFSGDTLFSLGCGRLFEGTAPMLWESFKKLRELPDDTQVFCGHEYTLDNARFVDQALPKLLGFEAHRQHLIERLNGENKTIPARLGDEKKFNPYFLADHAVLQNLGSTPAAVFAKIRQMKDRF